MDVKKHRSLDALITAAEAAYTGEQKTLASLMEARVTLRERLNVRAFVSPCDNGATLLARHRAMNRDAMRLAELDGEIVRARENLMRAMGRLRLLEERRMDARKETARQEEASVEKAAGR